MPLIFSGLYVSQYIILLNYGVLNIYNFVEIKLTYTVSHDCCFLSQGIS